MDDLDRRLLGLIEGGIPCVSRPYAQLARTMGIDESAVLARIRRLIEEQVISRFGLVVRHRSLGYRANAMVVWDVPESQVRDAGRFLAEQRAVTLSYRRPRRPPHWPYNLFCMIHGRDRARVLATIEDLRGSALLREYPYSVLFSRRCFRQRGARYGLSQSCVSQVANDPREETP